ncbi:ABC transporter permease [Spirochaeta dissipatitropha]
MRSKYLTAGRISMRNQLIYPAEYFSSLFTYLLFIFVFSQLYRAAVPEGGTIAGYSRNALMYYFVIAELVLFGFGRMFSQLADEVKTGQIAYILLRPFDFLRYQAAVMIVPVLPLIAVLAGSGFLLVFIQSGAPAVVQPIQAAAVLLSLLLSGLLSYYIQMILALTAFWFEENTAFFWIYQKLALVIGTLMPIEFLPDGLRRMSLLTPFPYLGYAPARIFTVYEPAQVLSLIGGQLAWTCVAALLSRYIYVTGCRKIAANGG